MFHDDRLLCTFCLATLAAGPKKAQHSGLRQTVRVAHAALLLALSWYAFFVLLRGLNDMPVDFHSWNDAGTHGGRKP